MIKIFLKLALTTVFLSSCICDPDDGQPEDVSDIAGVYDMVSWSAPIEQDLNQDGIASRNLVTESMCYSGTIVIANDHSYSIDYQYAGLEGSNLICTALASGGTWQKIGPNLHLTDTAGETVIYAYGTVNNVLTRSEASHQYPTLDGYQTGPVSIVFKKL